MSDVDINRIVLVGHSFGGSLGLLVAERDTGIKAAVVFAAAGYSWSRSPMLTKRLKEAVTNIKVPIMLIHDQNDYSTAPINLLDSLKNKLNKPHILKIYPKSGNLLSDGQNLVFQGIPTRKADVIKFLNESLKH
jgi:dienelactone hydrolase